MPPGRVLNLKTAHSQVIGAALMKQTVCDLNLTRYTNAIFHATGLRLRDLPIMPNKMIAHPPRC